MNKKWHNSEYPEYQIKRIASELKYETVTKEPSWYGDKYSPYAVYLEKGIRADYAQTVLSDLILLDKIYCTANSFFGTEKCEQNLSIYDQTIEVNEKIFKLLDTQQYSAIDIGNASLLFNIRVIGRFHAFLQDKYNIPKLLESDIYYARSYAAIVIDYSRDYDLHEILKNYLFSLKPEEHNIYEILEQVDPDYRSSNK